MKEQLDFIVIGAQKAGTTALFEYMRHHPNVCLPAGKEAPFYSHDVTWERGWESFVDRHFRGCREAQLWGTVTPHYMVGSLYEPNAPLSACVAPRPELLVPGRIARHSPDARLIALLRDPVQRAWSHFRMQVMVGAEGRSFDVAIEDALLPENLAKSRWMPTETASYVTSGEYGRILAGYREFFPAERLLVIYHDDLLADPAAVVASVFRFIGAESSFVPKNLGRRYRESGTRKRFRRFGIEELPDRLAAYEPARTMWHLLPLRGRRWIERYYRQANYRIGLLNRVRADGARDSAIPPAAGGALRAFYASDRSLLEELVGQVPWA